MSEQGWNNNGSDQSQPRCRAVPSKRRAQDLSCEQKTECANKIDTDAKIPVVDLGSAVRP